MRRAGVPEAEIARIRALGSKDAKRERNIIIDKDNVAAVRVFMRLRTQWRREQLVSPKRVAVLHTGLRYDAAEGVARALGVAWDAEMLDALLVLEAEAKRLLAEQTLADLRRP